MSNNDNDLETLLAALPSIRARVTTTPICQVHVREFDGQSVMGDDVTHDLETLLALVDALIEERKNLVVTAEDMEYLYPIRHIERLHSVITYLARMDNPLMVDEIFSEDEPLIEKLLEQGRIIQRYEPDGEPYYVPGAAKAGNE